MRRAIDSFQIAGSGSVIGALPGAILFVGSDGTMGQDSGNFSWSDEKNYLAVSDVATIANTTISRDADGLVTSVSKASGRTLTVNRDANDLISSITTADYTWTFARDANDQLITITIT